MKTGSLPPASQPFYEYNVLHASECYLRTSWQYLLSNYIQQFKLRPVGNVVMDIEVVISG